LLYRTSNYTIIFYRINIHSTIGTVTNTNLRNLCKKSSGKPIINDQE